MTLFKCSIFSFAVFDVEQRTVKFMFLTLNVESNLHTHNAHPQNPRINVTSSIGAAECEKGFNRLTAPFALLGRQILKSSNTFKTVKRA